MTMLRWLRQKLQRPFPLDLWSVRFEGSDIVTSDGQGTEKRLPIVDLKRVVIATDDSGPWDADVVFLLYSKLPSPVALFPLEAAGRDDFLKWLGSFPGFREQEVRKAMGSTKVARFEIFEAELGGS